MTPKEKAHNIFTLYNKQCLQILVGLVNRYKRKMIVKSCSLACVDQIKQMSTWVDKDCAEKEGWDLECTEEFLDEVEKELREL